MPLRISSFADECFAAAGKAASAAPSPANLPPYLFKYVSAQSALYTIRTGRVYFAHRTQFNDPVDGQVFINSDTAENRGKIAGRVRKIRQTLGWTIGGRTRAPGGFGLRNEREISCDYDRLNIGVFCMSDRLDSFSMWEHYAESHRGCCLVFSTKSFSAAASDWEKKFPFVFVGKVAYGEEYPKFPGAEDFAPHQEGSVYMTKSGDWVYEDEWRAIAYDSRGKSTPDGISTFQEAFADFPGLAEKMTGAGEYVLPNKHMLVGVALGNKITDSDKESVINAAMGRRLVVGQAVPVKRKIRMRPIYPKPQASSGGD